MNDKTLICAWLEVITGDSFQWWMSQADSFIELNYNNYMEEIRA